MANAIADMFRLLSPLTVDREINGKTVTFHTCSVRTCARLSSFISKMAGHLSVLMTSENRDQGKVEEDYQTKEGEIIQKTIVDPINPDLAELRVAKRKKAVEEAFSELMSEPNRALIGDLLMDSLKENFPRGEKRPADECLEFVDSMDVPTFIQFLIGLAAANAKVFGDLGKELSRAFQAKAGELLGTKAPASEARPTDG